MSLSVISSFILCSIFYYTNIQTSNSYPRLASNDNEQLTVFGFSTTKKNLTKPSRISHCGGLSILTLNTTKILIIEIPFLIWNRDCVGRISSINWVSWRRYIYNVTLNLMKRKFYLENISFLITNRDDSNAAFLLDPMHVSFLCLSFSLKISVAYQMISLSTYIYLESNLCFLLNSCNSIEFDFKLY